MTTIINRTSEKLKRRLLRKNATPEEKIMWFVLKNKKTGFKWRRQTSIGVYIADFYCREKQLVLELDGSHHENTLEYDMERTQYFKSIGINVIRFKNKAVRHDLSRVLQELMIALGEPTLPDALRILFK